MTLVMNHFFIRSIHISFYILIYELFITFCFPYFLIHFTDMWIYTLVAFQKLPGFPELYILVPRVAFLCVLQSFSAGLTNTWVPYFVPPWFRIKFPDNLYIITQKASDHQYQSPKHQKIYLQIFRIHLFAIARDSFQIVEQTLSVLASEMDFIQSEVYKNSFFLETKMSRNP